MRRGRALDHALPIAILAEPSLGSPGRKWGQAFALESLIRALASVLWSVGCVSRPHARVCKAYLGAHVHLGGVCALAEPSPVYGVIAHVQRLRI